MDDIADAKLVDLISPASQLYKLHCLKTKFKNCLTSDLAQDIEASMPLDLSNKYGCIFFKLVSHTFPDKEAHKRIIYEYILKLEIWESNNMEGFQRELRRHIKHYDAIQKFLEHHQQHSEGEDLARFINKTNNTKINIYRCNSWSIQYQLQPILIDARLHKSKSRRNQANR
jgi:hypothetical protein